ncbi:Dolichyl-phosphate-mannose--protein mannosyltransferase 4 [Fusarium oxysporum]|nr:Dolichyl-phosphate-mannose--protein mannosyltransferase 4 [Fusarium oxysporum]
MARSSTPQGSLRQRGAPSKKPFEEDSFDPNIELDKLAKAGAQRAAAQSETEYKIGLFLITILSFVTRFWGISHPNEVVFDEVHFGKFASYYLERTYFFDVHPPSASFSSPLSAGSLATMVTSTSRTSATPTLRIKFLMSRTELSPLL